MNSAILPIGLALLGLILVLLGLWLLRRARRLDAEGERRWRGAITEPWE